MNCSCGNKYGTRQRSGPTSKKKHWMILVDRCGKCGQLHPIHPKHLSFKEQDWIRRWNRNAFSSYQEEISKPLKLIRVLCDPNSTAPCYELDPNDTSAICF